MVIITKSTIHLLKKQNPSLLPVVHGNLDEERLDVETVPAKGGERVSSGLWCILVLAVLVSSAGILCGVELYRQCLKRDMIRYQGFCSVPMYDNEEQQLIEPHYRVMPLRWTSAPDTDVQVFNSVEEENDDTLREVFDIGDTFEKISVFNGPNSRPTSFIHDFQSNISGIVDKERCFVMELEPSMVLPPSMFVMSIEGGSAFDVTRARETMRALLPPLLNFVRLSRHIAEQCADKPTYRLQKDEETTIRKRSIEGPAQPAEYTHFSGKGVQEIDIDNLNELIAYEKAQA